ncbi:3-keto-5-aminohexanoate cleavage protein [Pseudaestuariivita atlantica]|uniref:3-keto-5-aminohexanoate cleavage protein n=1 Tax=Pseudaestuariivita atlantica TaxID=1317121 RepID=A0A0L1JLP2_9RHOB|nr:3-keto-5-aminohexanoate cleavage protein [Pseudaestuariivita atlantica]KNG92328.1 hypothetical protein ATO11_17055 [Pseudaestuariivita atlantica]
MLLQACLNGGRTRAEAARVPISAAEIAEDARLVHKAGAGGVHVHARDDEGRECLVPEIVATCVAAIRAAAPGLPVGLGTGLWSDTGGKSRAEALEGWQVCPDYVSINLNEADAFDVMQIMAGKGIGIEAGVWTTDDAHRLVAGAAAPALLRVLIEIQDVTPDEALTEAADIIGILERGGVTAPLLLHGEGQSAWACVAEAARRGLDTRIGYEDVLHMPDGTPAPSNADLLRAAAQMMARAA